MLTYSNAYALGFSRKKMLRISMKIQGVQQKLKKHVNFQGRGGLFRKLKFSGGTVNLTENPLKRKISSTGKGDTNSKEQTIQQNKNKNKKFWQSLIR